MTAEAIAFVGVAAQAERMLGNARRLDSSAAALALGLELAAPAPGRVWLARCVWCLERDERTRGEAAAVLRPCVDSSRTAGDCPTCAYSGPDVLAALLSISE